MSQSPRPLRALLRNALTWGVVFGVAGGSLIAAVSFLDPDPASGSLTTRLGISALAGLGWGVRFALAGTVVGALFAAVVRFGYRGRRLVDISPLRFGLLGALVAGAGVPLYLQAMNVLSGDGPVAWGLVLDDARWATVFGGAVAAGSILLARRAAGSDADGQSQPATLPGRAAFPAALPTPAPQASRVSAERERA